MAYFTAEDLGNDDEDGAVGWKYSEGARKPNRQTDPVSAAIPFATSDGTPPEWRQSPGVRSLTSRSFEAGGRVSFFFCFFFSFFSHTHATSRGAPPSLSGPTSDADSYENVFLVASQVARINRQKKG